MRTRTLLLSCTLAILAVAASADTAEACGGCFAPTGQVSVVTAHRMAVSMSPERTILWDQFEYAGDPEDFVWVLPVAGGEAASIELADNAFFLALQQYTQIQLQGPFRSPPSSGGGSSGFGCGASDALSAERGGTAAPGTNPVEIHHEGTIGPYETAVVGSEDPEALIMWMQERGYAVPDEMLPTIQHYVDAAMDFVILRLSPGVGVNRMQPVRVITPGMSTAFPLRMVAAGVADSVALELFIIAEGRYEAANFTNTEVDQSALLYDWATGEYNYDELAEAALAEDEGRAWLTEFAYQMNDYGMWSFSVTDEEGNIHRARDDWGAATESILNPTVTRMRADLPAQALGSDLILQASVEGGTLYNTIFVENDVNWNGGAPPPSRSGFPTPVVLLFGIAAYLIHRRSRAR